MYICCDNQARSLYHSGARMPRQMCQYVRLTGWISASAMETARRVIASGEPSMLAGLSLLHPGVQPAEAWLRCTNGNNATCGRLGKWTCECVYVWMRGCV